jgi:hypothetical protein
MRLTHVSPYRWLTLAVLSLCFHDNVDGYDAMTRLTARLKELQNKLETATDSDATGEAWDKARISVHREMRDAITEFIKSQLNSQHVSTKKLELDLKQSIEASIGNSWAERLLKCLNPMLSMR